MLQASPPEVENPLARAARLERERIGPDQALAPIAESATDLSDDDGPPGSKVIDVVQKAAADATKGRDEARLKAAISALDVFYDFDNNARLCVTRPSGRRDVLMVDSEEASDYVREVLKTAIGKPVSAQHVESVISTRRALARQRGDMRVTPLRIASHAVGEVLIDLANPAGDVVRVHAGGYTIEHQGAVLFRRGGGTGELPVPTLGMGPSQAYGLHRQVMSTWGFSQADAPMLVVMVAEWLRPGTPMPLCELVGGAGTGKSTSAEALASMIDPTPRGPIPTCPINEKALMARVQDRHVLLFDNASKASASEQDLLCRAATGGGISDRRYYCQHETAQAVLLNPVITTSILPVITRSDARSRTLSFTLRPMQGGVKSAEDVRAALAAQRADLFGAACALLSTGLAGLAAVKGQRTYTHRLVDFEQLGEAIHQALGQPQGWFGDLLAARRKVDAQDLAEGDGVLKPLMDVLVDWTSKATSAKPSARSWMKSPGWCAFIGPNGTPVVFATLPKLLKEIAFRPSPVEYGSPTYRPNTPQGLRNAIVLREPSFKALGWKVEVNRSKAGRSVVTAYRE
jgi:uncharacterized protein YcgL (UPF0745 family)